jgi:hypothetical protein
MTLYKITNELGYWYVVDTDPSSAVDALVDRLNAEDYGFRNQRIPTHIEVLTTMVTSALNSKWFFSDGSKLIISALEQIQEDAG